MLESSHAAVSVPLLVFPRGSGGHKEGEIGTEIVAELRLSGS